MSQQPFWKLKALSDMTQGEWESLCDGCAKCCLIQLEDDDRRLEFTDVACRLLNCSTGRCRDYANRAVRVPDCVPLTPDNVAQLNFMPQTCAYRLLAEGKDLPDWHPLVTGDPNSTAKAGMAVKGFVVSELAVDEDDLDTRIRSWPGE
ncbi:YcgN family cysteine cluster protein [Hyphobacterium marinum]|uniref:UPF0260 protein V0U35_11680 n=1 Tax=Hyphobacterium marinum TaxID=3116574 RepID=A0ABU7M0L1_9PROT|nr:YcgN family cysteine cluster protein [Hyphobacterium sp. Y6023]MEE2567338.1 YcgN family cysteine cluster protein [Hyphobacterium sp. Y6023]